MNLKSSKSPKFRYLFQLGQNHPLSLAEIASVFPSATLTQVDQNFFLFVSDQDPLPIVSRLGGTTKIARQVSELDLENLTNNLVEIIKNSQQKNFSLTFINATQPSQKITQTIKDQLHQEGINSRFISAPHDSLSPLIVTKQHVTEIIVDFKTQGLYVTVWVHDFKNWINRDRFKPYVDAKAGMLPPKLARIMVNLALGDRSPNNLTLLDPFCGTGTVLMEAGLSGLTVVGADLSQSQINGARQNLDWLGIMSKSTLIHADAVHLSQQINTQIDLIVTEPFLGPAKYSDQKVKDIVKGLQKLYLGALKDWSKFLKSGAKVVMVFPQFQVGKNTYQTSKFLDSQANLGYNLLCHDLVFTRPGARIIRQILVLTKN